MLLVILECKKCLFATFNQPELWRYDNLQVSEPFQSCFGGPATINAFPAPNQKVHRTWEKHRGREKCIASSEFVFKL